MFVVSGCRCADDFPVIMLNAEHREHEHWLASVAKHCVAGNRTTSDRCRRLMENLTRMVNVGVYAQVCYRACSS